MEKLFPTQMKSKRPAYCSTQRHGYTSHNMLNNPVRFIWRTFFLLAKLSNIMMQFGFFLITGLAVTAWLSDFLQQKCVAPLARVIPHSGPPVVQQASQWKTWANVLNRPTLLWLFSGAITTFRRYEGDIHADARRSPCSVFAWRMQAHAEFQVCLVLWSPGTCDGPPKSLLNGSGAALESYCKVSSESRSRWQTAGSVVQCWDSLLLCHC